MQRCLRNKDFHRQRQGGRKLGPIKSKHGVIAEHQIELQTSTQEEAYSRTRQCVRSNWMFKKQLHYRAGHPRSTSKISAASQLQLEKQRELKRLTTSLCVQMDDSTLTQWKALNMNRGWGGRLHGIENVMRRAKWGDISLLKF